MSPRCRTADNTRHTLSTSCVSERRISLSPVHTSDNVAKNGDNVAKSRDNVAETRDIVVKNGNNIEGAVDEVPQKLKKYVNICTSLFRL